MEKHCIYDFYKPIANPSNKSIMPIANYKRYGFNYT